jgi:Domain of unknown function (DUF4265)
MVEHPAPIVREPERIVVHSAPVWRDRADMILRVGVPQAPDGTLWFEQLWGRRVAPSRFELCCIPFAAYGYALGDTVEAPEEGPSAHTIARQVEGAGHAVLRAWLGDSQRETWDELQRLLGTRGLLWEFRKPSLVAIDLATPDDRRLVEEELREMEAAGRLQYEVGSQPFGSWGRPG